jgi:TetR/AcrR family transcriptional regulator, regulator of cefoperazone and chloramphenicol sensitivity
VSGEGGTRPSGLAIRGLHGEGAPQETHTSPDPPQSRRADGEATAQTDLTTRIRIRDAALEHFAVKGYERTTVRAIAQTAGVSHGMLRHHFGSKIELRAACDDYVFRVLHRLNTFFVEVSRTTDPSPQNPNPLWRYAARSLTDGSPTAAPIFDELIAMTARRLAPDGEPRFDESAGNRQAHTTLVAAMVTAIPLFHEHLSRTLGLDINSPHGEALLSIALSDVFGKRAHTETPIATATAVTSQ